MERTHWWCGTCGRDCAPDEVDCKTCQKWWLDNPPPGQDVYHLYPNEIANWELVCALKSAHPNALFVAINMNLGGISSEELAEIDPINPDFVEAVAKVKFDMDGIG